MWPSWDTWQVEGQKVNEQRKLASWGSHDALRKRKEVENRPNALIQKAMCLITLNKRGTVTHDRIDIKQSVKLSALLQSYVVPPVEPGRNLPTWTSIPCQDHICLISGTPSRLLHPTPLPAARRSSKTGAWFTSSVPNNFVLTLRGPTSLPTPDRHKWSCSQDPDFVFT